MGVVWVTLDGSLFKLVLIALGTQMFLLMHCPFLISICLLTLVRVRNRAFLDNSLCLILCLCILTISLSVSLSSAFCFFFFPYSEYFRFSNFRLNAFFGLLKDLVLTIEVLAHILKLSCDCSCQTFNNNIQKFVYLIFSCCILLSSRPAHMKKKNLSFLLPKCLERE